MTSPRWWPRTRARARPSRPTSRRAEGERAGRLVAADEGVRTDTEKDLVAEDVGIDGAAAGAEEAAVHVVDDPEPADPLLLDGEVVDEEPDRP